MIAHATGIMTSTYEKWVNHTERKTAKGIIAPGYVAAVRFTINGIYQGETRIRLEHVNRIANDAAPDWPSGNENDVYRVDIEGTPSIFRRAGFASPTVPDAGCGGRLPGDRYARAERGTRGQRPVAGLGHRPGSPADCGGGHNSMTWRTG